MTTLQTYFNSTLVEQASVENQFKQLTAALESYDQCDREFAAFKKTGEITPYIRDIANQVAMGVGMEAVVIHLNSNQVQAIYETLKKMLVRFAKFVKEIFFKFIQTCKAALRRIEERSKSLLTKVSSIAKREIEIQGSDLVLGVLSKEEYARRLTDEYNLKLISNIINLRHSDANRDNNTLSYVAAWASLGTNAVNKPIDELEDAQTYVKEARSFLESKGERYNGSIKLPKNQINAILNTFVSDQQKLEKLSRDVADGAQQSLRYIEQDIKHFEDRYSAEANAQRIQELNRRAKFIRKVLPYVSAGLEMRLSTMSQTLTTLAKSLEMPGNFAQRSSSDAEIKHGEEH